MLWASQVLMCRKCTSEAAYLCLASLAELAVFLAHLFMVGSHKELQFGISSTMIQKLVVSLLYVPFISLTLFSAVDCLLQLYYFRESGVHSHLADLFAWMGAWLDYSLVYSWWVVWYLAWYVRQLREIWLNCKGSCKARVTCCALLCAGWEGEDDQV